MTSKLDNLIGVTAFTIIKDKVAGSNIEDRPFFRVKNLKYGETMALIENWDKFSIGNRLEGMNLVVSADDNSKIPSKYRADAKRSITDYRNNNDNGLIYIENELQSDAQGLQSIFSLTDRNFLDGTFDAGGGNKISELIFCTAWVLEGGNASELSSHLKNLTVAALEALHPNLLSISVRSFGGFCLSICRERLDIGGVLDEKQMESLVGRNLVELGLFPDPEWRLQKLTSKTNRRLELNSLRADLAESSNIDLDVEKTIQAAETTIFKDHNNEPYDNSEQIRLRKLCINYLQDPNKQLRTQIYYKDFAQLFNKDIKGLQLGERVEVELSERSEQAAKEFAELDVKQGLNCRQTDDAAKFLAHQMGGNGMLLSELLSTQTLQMVEKAAQPKPERFSNPLVLVARIAQVFRERNKDGLINSRMLIKPSIDIEECGNSCGLFAFLYSNTLLSVSEDSKLDSAALEISLDDSLTQINNAPNVVDEGEPEEHWKPLQVEFLLLEKSTGNQIDIENGYEWLPDEYFQMCLFWLLISSKDRPAVTNILTLPLTTSYDTWLDQTVTRTLSFSSIAGSNLPSEIAEIALVEKLLNTIERIRETSRSSGLGSKALSDFFDEWSQLVTEAKDRFVTDGLSDDRVRAILSMDCIEAEEGARVIMLPTHPFKLRWIAKYLEESEKLATKSLAGELPLNRKNPRFYLDWFSSLTPHQQPAVISNRADKILLATRERGWTEQFEPLSNLNKITGSTMDSVSINEIVTQINVYLESHPYKKDGLSILIVPTALDPELPSVIVQKIRTNEWKNTPIKLHILSHLKPQKAISSFMEALPGENRMGLDDNIFPPLQIVFHNMTGVENVGQLLGDHSFDIAVIAKSLGENLEVQEATEPNFAYGASFNPLVSEPVHVYGGSGGGAISVSMRPEDSDPVTDAWSTLTIRQHRTRPVAPSQPENTDFAELRINFKEAAKLFEELHKVAHWVITYERYIAREQIESLQPRPDILTIKEGVGSNGLYTLIVSSNSGRDFVIQRLARKILRISGGQMGAEVVHNVASNVYDETKQIAPRVVLQAMGLSRITEEILGLKVARHLSAKNRGLTLKEGVIAWVSLDEHPNWFKGPNPTRADMVRFSFGKKGNQWVADVLVVESKLRQAYDGHGEKQVNETLKLLDDIFSTESEGFAPIDTEVWRDRIISAIDDAATEAKSFFGETAEKAVLGKIPGNLREVIKSGNFKVNRLDGIYSICNYNTEGETSILNSGISDRIKIINSYKNELWDLFQTDSDQIFECEQHQTVDSSPFEIKCEQATNNNKADSRKLSLAELDARYQRILDTFAEFDISVTLPDDPSERYVEGPASILFRIKPGLKTAPAKLCEKIDALKLRLSLAEDQSIRFFIDQGNVNFDIPKKQQDRYFVDAQQLWDSWSHNKQYLQVPIGEDRLGKIVSINFSSTNSPHLLIGGTTGSGKSEALNTILEGLVKLYTDEELNLQLIDPKGTELLRFEDRPHLKLPIASEPSEAIEILDNAVIEMQKRYLEFKACKVRELSEFNKDAKAGAKIPRLLIVLDEYADLTAENEDKKAIEKSLKRLAAKARAAGIHVIIATQKPSTEVISSSLRSNLPAQLALRVRGANESRVIMEDTGAETLNGKGDAFLKIGGKLTRVQCGLVP